MKGVIGLLGISLLALPAQAQSLKQQVTGVWMLTEGSEQMQDGKKVVPWSAGELILDPSGHFAFFVFGKDRQKPEGPPDPRAPVGPMVAYYGTFTADETAKTLTYHVENASSPTFNGVTRTQYVTVTSDTLITKGSPVKTPQGEITPINEWRREK
jgi:Lipocalin-like domain